MPTGTVKGFDKITGYAIIQPDFGEEEIHVPPSTLHKSGLSNVHKKQKVAYDLEYHVEAGICVAVVTHVKILNGDS